MTNEQCSFLKTMENVRKHREMKRTELSGNYLVSEPNYHTTKFSKN